MGILHTRLLCICYYLTKRIVINDKTIVIYLLSVATNIVSMILYIDFVKVWIECNKKSVYTAQVRTDINKTFSLSSKVHKITPFLPCAFFHIAMCKGGRRRSKEPKKRIFWRVLQMCKQKELTWLKHLNAYHIF